MSLLGTFSHLLASTLPGPTVGPPPPLPPHCPAFALRATCRDYAPDWRLLPPIHPCSQHNPSLHAYAHAHTQTLTQVWPCTYSPVDCPAALVIASLLGTCPAAYSRSWLRPRCFSPRSLFRRGRADPLAIAPSGYAQGGRWSTHLHNAAEVGVCLHQSRSDPHGQIWMPDCMARPSFALCNVQPRLCPRPPAVVQTCTHTHPTLLVFSTQTCRGIGSESNGLACTWP